MIGRERIQNTAATNCCLWRVGTYDEAIAEHADHWRFKAKLNESGIAGLYLAGFFQHSNPGQHLSRADVNPNALARTQGARSILQQLRLGIDNLSRQQSSDAR